MAGGGGGEDEGPVGGGERLGGIGIKQWVESGMGRELG